MTLVSSSCAPSRGAALSASKTQNHCPPIPSCSGGGPAPEAISQESGSSRFPYPGLLAREHRGLAWPGSALSQGSRVQESPGPLPTTWPLHSLAPCPVSSAPQPSH